MLGVYSQLKKQSLKHNVIERDKVLIPPSWDSWGKIRVLREGFDVEGISRGWSIDVQSPSHPSRGVDKTKVAAAGENSKSKGNGQKTGVISAYEEVIKDPHGNDEADPTGPNQGIEIPPVNTQEFLAGQLEIIERLKVEDEKSQDAKHSKAAYDRPMMLGRSANPGVFPGRIDEHIGPVQFNFGGIQVDSDGMAKIRKDQTDPTTAPEKDAQLPSTPDKQNEALKFFFKDLIERGGTGNP